MVVSLWDAVRHISLPVGNTVVGLIVGATVGVVVGLNVGATVGVPVDTHDVGAQDEKHLQTIIECVPWYNEICRGHVRVRGGGVATCGKRCRWADRRSNCRGCCWAECRSNCWSAWRYTRRGCVRRKASANHACGQSSAYHGTTRFVARTCVCAAVVSLPVGNAVVGLIVGVTVGIVVGLNVGATVGAVVGVAVGTLVGVVGASVGTNVVGETLGISVGVRVGPGVLGVSSVVGLEVTVEVGTVLVCFVVGATAVGVLPTVVVG